MSSFILKKNHKIVVFVVVTSFVSVCIMSNYIYFLFNAKV